MSSTSDNARPAPTAEPAWRAAGLLYHSVGFYLRRTFGRPVWKISVDAGFTCPNVDGSLGSEGCVYCNVRSFAPSRRGATTTTRQQIAHGISALEQRHPEAAALAYFQPSTNTYGPVDRLALACDEALAQPKVVGIAIGTRPDCLSDDAIAYLAGLSQRTWLLVELGLQSIHDRSLRWLNRGHLHRHSLDAIARAARQGIRLGVHLILGIPGEDRQAVMATADEIARLPIHSVKLHNLYAVRDTALAASVERGEVSLVDMPTYVELAADFLERLPDRVVVDRLCGDAPPEYLISPSWCLNKAAVKAGIENVLRQRASYQGSRCPQERSAACQ